MTEHCTDISNTEFSRRRFIEALGASALVGSLSGASPLAPQIVFGILSDTHITDYASTGTLRRALEYFNTRNVDAVVVSGDITDHGLVRELRAFAKAWFDVFPGDLGKNGQPVKRIFIPGNHDVGVFGRESCSGANMGESDIPVEGSDDIAMIKVGFAKVWKSVFGEEYRPFRVIRVKGFDFLCAGWDPSVPIDLWSPTPERQLRCLRDALAKIDTSRPFFHIQHPHLKGTVLEEDYVFTHDDAAVTRILNNYPYAVAISGHSHVSLTDERCFWRGNFTAVAASTLKKVNASAIHDNHASVIRKTDGADDVRQGLVAAVFGDRIVFERRDFGRGEDVDEPWVATLPACRNAARCDRKEYLQTPRFPDGAKIDVELPDLVGEDGRISFPAAIASEMTRPFDYEIKVEHIYAGILLTLGSFRILNPSVMLPKRYDRRFPLVSCPLESRHLPKYDLGRVRVTVSAYNSLGAAGESIVSEWTDVPKM